MNMQNAAVLAGRRICSARLTLGMQKPLRGAAGGWRLPEVADEGEADSVGLGRDQARGHEQQDIGAVGAKFMPSAKEKGVECGWGRKLFGAVGDVLGEGE